MSTPPFLPDLFASIDRMDAPAFARFIAEDGTFRFGNGPEVTGRTAITEAVAGFFTALGGLSHKVLGSWAAADRVFIEGEVTYTRKDATSITLPFFNVLEMRGNLVGRYVIYADLGPLWQREGA